MADYLQRQLSAVYALLKNQKEVAKESRIVSIINWKHKKKCRYFYCNKTGTNILL